MTTARKLIEEIKEDEELREEVQSAILNQDLLNLPADFRAFVQRQEAFNQRHDDFVAEIREYHRNWERKYNHDVEYMKSFTSTSVTRDELPLLAAKMDLEYRRSLSRQEIVNMALSLAQGAPISGDFESFAKADIIFAAGRNGEECYVPVEVSFTADRRDTGRAIRNAGFITQATGAPALPVVASVNIDHRILDEIKTGKVYYHNVADPTETPE